MFPTSTQREGSTTLRIIFHHTVIETCFDMLKTQKMRNNDAIQILDPPILKIILKLGQLIPQFHSTIEF